MLIEDLYRECFTLPGDLGFKDPAKAMAILSELHMKRERLMLVKESLFDLDAKDNLLDSLISSYTIGLGLCERGKTRELLRSVCFRQAREADPATPRFMEVVRAYLSVYPGDFRLLERNGADLPGTLSGLRREYAFAAAPPMRALRMNSPRAIAPFAQGGFAVVACDAKKVLLLDREGCLKGEATGPFQGMHGLFPSPVGTVWVCDFGGDRLYEIAPDGRMLRFVECSKALGSPEGEARCVTGCVLDGRIFLQVCGPAFETGRLAVLAQAGDEWAGHMIEAPAVTKPGGIHGVDGEIWYADRQRPTLTAWDPATGESRTVFRDPSLLLINDFAVWDGNILMSTDRGLSKYTAGGAHVFSHAFKAAEGGTSITMRMHAERGRGEQGEKCRVHVCDIGMNAVHVVLV